MIHVRALGALEVTATTPDGASSLVTQPKRLALLLYLALAEPSGLHARDRLLAMFWPEADDNSSRHSLRNALHGLRQALGEDAIVTRGEAYVGLDFQALSCDALGLRAHLAAGRLDEAVALWTGELAPGFHVSGIPEFEHWLDGQREGLHRAVRAAAWKLADALKGAGAAEVEAVRRAVRLDPGDEPGARRLMTLLSASGDRAGALRAYQELTAYFARDLDAEPSTETRRLAARLRVISPAAPSAASPRVAPPATEMPAAGLAPAGPGASITHRGRRTVAIAVFIAAALGGAVYLARSPLGASPARKEAERAVLRLPDRYRADTSAYASYLRGLTLRFDFRFAASRDTFAALVDRNPLYVPGLYGLAHAYIFNLLNGLTDPGETWLKVDELSRRALALDSTAASAWFALAGRSMFQDVDLARAGELIERGRRLDPLDPDGAAIKGVWFRFHGQMDSAVAMVREAHQLDPLSPFFTIHVGRALYFARRYPEAARVFEDLLQEQTALAPADTDLATVYRAMGRYQDAVEWLRQGRLAAGDSVGARALPDVQGDSAAARVLASDTRRVIAQLDHAARAGNRVAPSAYAYAYADLRDTLAMLRWLDSVSVLHDTEVLNVRVDPRLDFIRQDPRFRAWEAATGLPPLAPPAHGGLAF